MLNLNLLALVPAIPEASDHMDVTEAAMRHASWASLGATVLVSQEVKQALVDWTERDARRSDTGDEITPEIRLDNLLAEAAAAVRNVKYGAGSELFLAEYFDRMKRGNPRRVRLQIRRQGDTAIIDFPA